MRDACQRRRNSFSLCMFRKLTLFQSTRYEKPPVENYEMLRSVFWAKLKQFRISLFRFSSRAEITFIFIKLNIDDNLAHFMFVHIIFRNYARTRKNVFNWIFNN